MKHRTQFRVVSATVHAEEQWSVWHLKLECGHVEHRRPATRDHVITKPQEWAKCFTCLLARKEESETNESSSQQE